MNGSTFLQSSAPDTVRCLLMKLISPVLDRCSRSTLWPKSPCPSYMRGAADGTCVIPMRHQSRSSRSSLEKPVRGDTIH
ncbi:hypothetical protein LEMLEM_LOCUS4588 [Lemmus lemmus]